MVQWGYVLISCDYVPSGLPGQTLIQLWLQLTNETCVTRQTYRTQHGPRTPLGCIRASIGWALLSR